MRQWLTALAGVLLTASFTVAFAWARPMDSALQQQLLALYRHYNQTVAAGHLDDALAMRSPTVRQELAAQLKTPKDRDDYLATARTMTTGRLDVRHADVNDAGDKALLIALADHKTASGTEQNELDLSFVKEGNAWKLGETQVGPGPSAIKRCTDTRYEPLSAYDASRPVSLAGRIERVDFQPDHTLVVVLSGDTEVCAFLPDRASLQQHGLDPATLQPYRVADISGIGNRQNPQKVMVNSITVHAEE